jgi:signal transduction histidine kinase
MAALSELILPAAVLIIILFMSVHIASALLGRPSGIDNLFVSEDANAPYTAVAGRPSEGTIMSFLLIAAAGIVASRKPSNLKRILKGIGLAVASFGGLALAGYAASIPLLYFAVEGASSGMAIHAAILFLTIGSSLMTLSRLDDKPNSRSDSRSVISIRTKFTSMLLIVSILPVLFIGGVTLNNSRFLQIEQLAGSIAVLGFATAVAVTFFALSLSRSLLAPLLSLKATIDEFTRGNYGAEIKVNSSDEIGTLAQDFRQMRDRIVETNDNLERIVSVRTAELLASKKQLEIVIGQLQEQEKVMKNFINVAAHEIKNPIAPILMASQLFAKREVDSKITLTRKELDLITQNALRLKGLCEDILDVARIENNGITLEKSQFNLSELARLTIEDAKSTLKPGVELKFVGPDRVLLADRDKLQQVIQNLIQNAIKFTHEGAIQVSVTHSSNGELVLSVKDSGKGIDSEILPRLFSKFATKSEKGTGLGLYISKNIVEAHGGRIWAENNPDLGATFAFSVPLSPVGIQQTNEMA